MRLKMAAALLFMILVSCAGASYGAQNGSLPSFSASPRRDLDRAFMGVPGFAGGDGFYSAAISRARFLVFFGDTVRGCVSGGKRVMKSFINNTVAMVSHDGRRVSVKPYLEDAFCPFWKPDVARQAGGNRFIWPLDASIDSGRLVAFGAEIEKTGGGGAFDFRESGNYVWTIEDSGAPLETWKKSAKKVPHARYGKERYLQWGSALLEHDGYFYIYGTYRDRSERRLVLARSRLGRLDDFSAWEFYDGGTFRSGAIPLPLMGGTPNEFSVVRAAGGRFFMIFNPGSMDGRIRVKVSDTPVFTDQTPFADVYLCPEHGRTRNIFTYSAKAVKPLCSENSILAVYFANSFSLDDLVNEPWIYWPRFVEITIR